MAASAGAIRAGAAYVEASLRDGPLQKGLKAAENRLRTFGRSVSAIGGQFLKIGGVAAAGVGLVAKIFTGTGDALTDMSARTGIGVEALQELQQHFAQSGASAEDLEKGVKRMQTFLAAVAGGSKAAGGVLRQLGLNFRDLAGLSPEEQLEKIGDALAGVGNEAKRTELAKAVFGGTKLLPGAQEGIGKGRQTARDSGTVASAESVAAADQLGDSFGTLMLQAKAAAMEIGAILAPHLGSLVATGREVLTWVIEFVRENSGLITTVATVAGGIAAVGAAFAVIGPIIGGIGTALGVVSGLLSGVGAVFGVVTGVLGAILSPIGLVVAAVVGLGAVIAAMLIPAEDMGSFFSTVWDGIVAAWEWGVGIVKDLIDRIKAEIEVAGITFQLFKETAIFAFESIPTVAKWFWETLKAIGTWIWNNWPKIFTETGKLIVQVFKSIGNVAAAVWTQIKNLFSGKGFSFTAIGDSFMAEMDKIKEQAGRVVEDLKLPELDLSGVNPERAKRIEELRRQRAEALAKAMEEIKRQREGGGGAEGPGAAAEDALMGFLTGGKSDKKTREPLKLKQAEAKLESAGTFQAAAADSLAVADSLAKDQLDEMQQMNDKLDTIAENTGNNGFA